MGSARDVLQPRRPCLGLSPTCDCPFCREHRHRSLERAAVLEERAKEFRRWDEEEGRCPPPPPRVPLAAAAVRLEREPDDISWADFWRSLDELAQVAQPVEPPARNARARARRKVRRAS